MSNTSITMAVVPEGLIDALEAVLAEIWARELYDYRSVERGSPEQMNHVFPKLETIRRWLDYLEEDLGMG